MKSTLLLLAGLLLLTVSCQNASNDAKTDAKDSSKTMAQAPAVPAKPASVMRIWHKVSNFNKWMDAYEKHDSARVSFGLHNYVIGRDLDDTNLVIVALHMDDLAKAKAFSAQPDLKTIMQKGGVVGAPDIAYLDVQSSDTTTNASTIRLGIQSKVKDYDVWKKAFDSHLQVRTDAGLTLRSISKGFDDPNVITLVFAVADVKKAKDFLQSKDLKDRMEASGVVGKPAIHMYTIAKKY